VAVAAPSPGAVRSRRMIMRGVIVRRMIVGGGGHRAIPSGHGQMATASCRARRGEAQAEGDDGPKRKPGAGAGRTVLTRMARRRDQLTRMTLPSGLGLRLAAGIVSAQSCSRKPI